MINRKMEDLIIVDNYAISFILNVLIFIIID